MTIAQFKSLLRREGKTIRQWAEENGFPPEAVYRTFNGVLKGNYGRANEILSRAGVNPPDRQAA